MVRLALVLAIAGGLVLFALQNLAPMSLVILGVRSQPLPLAVWVLGAMIAGSLTTLLISGLFTASSAFSAPRLKRPKAKRSPNRSNSAANPRNPGKPNSPPPPRTASVMGDDWEPRPPLEEWEDWEGYEEPAKTTTASSSTAQTSYSGDRYSQRQEPYAEPVDATSSRDEQEVWDDWDEEDEDRQDYRDRDTENDRSLDDQTYIPRRTDFEVRQEPVARQQSGSIYSYSYRSADDREDSSVGKTEDVYDAEFRVITPPYNPDADSAELDTPTDDEFIDEPLNPDDDPDDWIDEDEPTDAPRDRNNRNDWSDRSPSEDDW